MKKVFLKLSLILVVIMVISAQSITAQTTINVIWDDQCTAGPTASEYQVSIDISDVCKEVGIHYDSETLPLSASATSFVIGDFCDIPIYEPCYRLTITVKRVSTINGKVISEETFVGFYNCTQFEALDGSYFPFILTC